LYQGNNLMQCDLLPNLKFDPNTFVKLSPFVRFVKLTTL
jgi:hypothetical protein